MFENGILHGIHAADSANLFWISPEIKIFVHPPEQDYLTTCLKRIEFAGACLESPLYSAVTKWEPGVIASIVKLAIPSFSEALASIVLPSNSSTEPPGISPVIATTLAEKLIGSFDEAGFNIDASRTVLLTVAAVTVIDSLAVADA